MYHFIPTFQGGIMSEYSKNWIDKIQPFADAVGHTIDEVTEALKPELGEPTDQALEVLGNESYTPFASLQTCLSALNIPPAILRKNIQLLRTKPVIETPTNVFSMSMTTILPPILDDKSFLEALKVGGVLKVGITEVTSAIKAALAKKVRLFDIPKMLADKMEQFAEDCNEPVGTEFFEIRNMVIKKNYADVMHALGIEGSFVTESRKDTFLKKLESVLWDEISNFQNQLAGWNKNWNETASNPAMLTTTIVSALSGGAGAVMPTGMMQPPDTAYLKDAAESTITVINKIFAGFGIPIARALAYEAQKIKTILENDRLPMMIGATNRELMLKMLGVDVTSDYVRLERNLVQYVVALMEYPKITSGQNELLYLSEMLKLGVSIDFNRVIHNSNSKSKQHSSF